MKTTKAILTASAIILALTAVLPAKAQGLFGDKDDKKESDRDRDKDKQSSSTSEHQNGPQTFIKGTNVLNLGIGIGGYYSYWGAGYSATPNFIISYEHGAFGDVGPGTISLGGLLSYKGITDSWIDTYNYTEKLNYWIIGFRSAYHWNFTSSDKFDPYAGLMLGYYIVSNTFTSNDPDYNKPGNPGYGVYSANYRSYFDWSLYLGARYYLSSKVGLWAELGYGYSTLSIGVNFKL